MSASTGASRWPRAAFGTLACLAGACIGGPYTLWRGKSLDRRHSIEVVEVSGRQSLQVDGAVGVPFDAIASRSLTLGGDGNHMAYAARRDGRWYVVHDGNVGPSWDAIGEIVMSAHKSRLAYSAERAGLWHVVVDERPGPGFGTLLAGTLRFSDDAEHLAYVAGAQEKVRVIVDDLVGPAFDGVGMLAVSHDGGHVAYAARRGGYAHVVSDGVLGEPWDAIDEIVLGTNGRLAYIGRRGGRARVQWSRLDEAGLEDGADYEAPRGIRVSSDGRHLAWVARIGGADAVIVDNRPIEPSYPSVVAPSLAFRPGTSEVAFIVRDEEHRARARLGDRVGGPFHEIQGNRLVFSTDGSRYGYTGRRGAAFIVVLDGAEGRPQSWAGRPVFSARGTRVGYLARRGTHTDVIVDGESHEFDLAMEGTLAFSGDARHWACLAGSAKERQFFFVVDGRPTSELEMEEIVSAAARFSLDDVVRGHTDEVLRTWALKEAELASH